MLEPVLQRWQGLSPRDRRMLMVGIGFLLVVGLWQFAFQPAWKGRQILARELPALRADLAQMDQLTAEARLASTSSRGGSEGPAQLRARLEDSLNEAGLGASVAQLEASGDIIEARFSQAAFDKWLYWVDGAVRDTRMRIVDLSLTREGAGVVSGRVAFEALRRSPG